MCNYKFTLPIYGVIKPTNKAKNPALTLNWYRNAHPQVSNNAKKKFKHMICDQLNQFDKIEGQLSIHYKYYAKRQGTDLDNFVAVAKKFFQDSLTESGLIYDDNSSVIVKNSEEYCGVDKENPRVEAFVFVVE